MDVAALYRQLYRIRRVEEEIARIYPTDAIKSPVHLSIGQEAISVGVCDALHAGDVVFGTYRSHALYLAKGGDLKRMIAELFGKATGCSHGKGGSMHLIDVAHGVMGASAVVGTTIPLAVGYAYALRLKEQSAIVATFFGDGAVEEGVFHESLNFAALKQLPVLFVCENNQYAIHSPLRARQPHTGIASRAGSYGVPAVRIDDGDVIAIAEAAGAACAAIRSGGGPQFLECLTYRWKQHVGPDDDFAAGYRLREEADRWFASDWTRTIGARLDAATRDGIAVEIEAEIRDAFAFADSSPFPDPGELYTDSPPGA
jgi:TPP-dependent pyruvate/acetoin dehydrogenase alpha subunit